MNKPLILLLLLLIANTVVAQEISVSSFESLPNDLDARVNFPVKDQNGDLCALINPTGPSTAQSYRVFRGGGWGNYAQGCLAARRYSDAPGNRGSIGFRLVVSPK